MNNETAGHSDHGKHDGEECGDCDDVVGGHGQTLYQ